jgi:transglycosylase-like protein with SLT domain
LGGLTVQSFRKASALRRLARKAPIVIITAGLLTVTPLSAASAAQVDPPHSSHKASSASTPLLTAFIAEASQRFQVPVAWIRAVMHVESGGRLRAVSPKGAMGLMQIMPKTYAGLRLRYHLGEDPYDPRDNILAGAAYLREMHDRYGSPGFLAAYNAGPERYDEHLATGRPLPIETQAYVAMLMPMIDIRQPDGKIGASFDLVAWLRAALFPNSETVDPNGKTVHPSGNRMTFNALPNRRPTNVRIVDLSALTPRSDGLFVHLAEENRSQ